MLLERGASVFAMGAQPMPCVCSVSGSLQAVAEVLKLHKARNLDAARAEADKTSLVFHEFAVEPSYLACSAFAPACSMSQSCAAMLHTWDALQCMHVLCSAL